MKRVLSALAWALVLVLGLCAAGSTALAAQPAVNKIVSVSLRDNRCEAGEKFGLVVRTSARGRLTVALLDGQTGARLRTLYSKTRSRGTTSISTTARVSPKGAPLTVGKVYVIRTTLKVGRTTYQRDLSVIPTPVLPRILSAKGTKYYYPDNGNRWAVTVDLSSAGRMEAALYDKAGSPVAVMCSATPVKAGKSVLYWSGKDASGAYLPTGSYTMRMRYQDAAGNWSNLMNLTVHYDKPPVVEQPAAIWARFQQPVTVVNAHYLSQVYITSRPGGGRRVGYTFGTSAGVKVLGASGAYSYVEINPYKGSRALRGYIRTSRLKTVQPASPFGMLVDKKTQRLTIYRNGAVVKHWKISTAKPGANTPKGEYIIPNRKSGFRSGALYCRYAVRVVGRIYFHEIPNRRGNYREFERMLGKPASAGCIRVPVGAAKWIYDNVPNGTKVIVQ